MLHVGYFARELPNGFFRAVSHLSVSGASITDLWALFCKVTDRLFFN